ncbi:protein transport protein SEC13 [Strigomonas culicis]|uniref:Protein transport protein SEC13 n=2 Tax=Strigomonas culicis TaxID=28005 RepID=S9UU97_9TRYP|nr:protein transport protein SEC13 [Strigomonas culicis]|eukprot:EPY32394.1 protein transport protein SEC13 [Strigomonas culicis]
MYTASVNTAPQEQEHKDLIHDTQFDFYGQLLATAGSDRTVGVYTAAGGPLRRIATLSGHDGPVWAVKWAHPRFGKIVASGSYDQKAILWKEQAQGWGPIHVISVHRGSVNAVDWAPDIYGPILATASSDGTIAVTPYRGGVWQDSVRVSNNSNHIAHAMGATCVSFAPFKTAIAGRLLLASGGCDGRVRIWTSLLRDGVEEPFTFCQALENHQDWVYDVSFSPMSSSLPYLLLASCGKDNCVIIYREMWDELAAGFEEDRATSWEQSVVKFDNPCWKVSWSPSGEKLIVTTASAEVFVLYEGSDFVEPWIKVPLSSFENQ